MSNVFEALSTNQAIKRSSDVSESASDDRKTHLSTDIVDFAALNSFTIPKAKKKKGEIKNSLQPLMLIFVIFRS